ncbi:MAG: flippase [Bacteroidales bacterium]|nr:flippase [Bacteroidales bacterium]
MNISSRFNLSENAVKVTKNIGWAVAGKTVSLLGGLLVGILVARYLGPEQYGLMNYVISYVCIFQVFATFGLDSIEIREESRHPEERDVIIGTAFTIKIILAAITLAAVAVSVTITETDSFTRWMIMLYSVSIVLNSLNVIRNHFTSLVWNEYVVKTEISRTVIGALIKIGLLFAKAGLGWFIAVYTFDFVLLASGYCTSYRLKIGRMKLWRFDIKWAKYLVAQSFPLMLTGAAVMIYQRIDQVMIGKMIDSASVGQFSVASKFVEVLIFVPTIIAQTVAPILIRTREKDYDEYKKKSQVFMNVTIWGSVFMAVVTSLVSYYLVILTFGEKYLPAVAILQILSFKAVSVALSNTAGQLLIIEGLQKYAILRDGFGCVICVVFNLLLIPRFGTEGAAVVAILSNLSAGYIADLFIPQYRHLFRMQSKALLLGWKDIFKIKSLLKS